MGMFGGAFVSLQAPLATKTATDMRFGGTMVGQALCESTWSVSDLPTGLTSASCPVVLAACMRTHLRCCIGQGQRGGSKR